MRLVMKHSPMSHLSVLALLAGVLATAQPAKAADQQTVTLIDLSSDGRAQREIAHDVARALRRHPKIRFRSVSETLNVGGEDLHRNNVRSAKSLLRSATNRMKVKEWEDAAEELESAVTNLISSFAYAPNQKFVEQVLVLHGVALYKSGEKKDAARAFRRSIAFHPKTKHDLSKYGKGVMAAYAKARDKILLRKPVTWEIRTEPANAEVWVNGRYYGLSPTFVRSFSGPQYIRLTKQGYARFGKIKTLKKDNSKASFTLKAARRRPAFVGILERLVEIFDGAVEPNDLSEAQGLLNSPQAVALLVTGSREKMKVQLALANLSGRQVVKRLTRTMPWMRRDKKAVEKLVIELFKAPDIPKHVAPVVRTDTVFKKWWFWGAVGVVAAGAVTAAVLLSRTTEPPAKYKPGEGGLIIRF
ncbi:MAG: PEGA domain-containing protein [Myxococcales bacterium]|nr:PEGA domain-containing protein [Myxococcales bacterium]